MATPNAARIRRYPARLVLGPTDLTAAFPYGGTAVGYFRSFSFRPNVVRKRVLHEGLGQVTETHEVRAFPVLAGVLEEFDKDLLAQIASAYSTTGNSYQGNLRIDGGAYPRYVPPTSSLFVDALAFDGICAFLRRPLPCFEPDSEWLHSLKSNYAIPVMFDAVPDDSGKPSYSHGRREVIVL